MKLLVSRDIKISSTKQMSVVSVCMQYWQKKFSNALFSENFAGKKFLTFLAKSGSGSYRPNLILRMSIFLNFQKLI